MDATVQVKKIKNSATNGNIFISYSYTKDGPTDNMTAESDESAEPGFYQAMGALKLHAGNILGFNVTQSGKLSVHTVNFSYNDGNMAAVISATYETPSGLTTDINTPRFKCPLDEVDAQKPGYFDAETVKALWALEREARRYLEGKRGEMSLFDEEEEADAGADNAGDTLDGMDTDGTERIAG